MATSTSTRTAKKTASKRTAVVALDGKKKKTAKDKADKLVAKSEFDFTRGRVYTSVEVVEAQVRVLEGGKAEIVPVAGDHHVQAVLVFRNEGGAAVLQNLRRA